MRDSVNQRTCRAAGQNLYGITNPAAFLFGPCGIVQLWYERVKQRQRLGELDEHLLRDIGIDRNTAMEEASKPFWRR
jgi:uncharacterized protein YjiS (DUF1127 family)